MAVRFGKEVVPQKMLKLLELDALKKSRVEKFQKILARKHAEVSFASMYIMLYFNLATKCNNHLTMLDLTKMTVENAPEDPESIKIEGSNPQNQPNPLVLQADSPAGVTIKPSTSGEKLTLRLSLYSICTIIFLFV